jgi:hypothetical protein
MRRAPRRLLAGLLLMLSGCAHSGYTRTAPAPAGQIPPVYLSDSDNQRPALVVDVTEATASSTEEDAGFCKLSESDAQQIAATRSLTGNLLARESDAVAAQGLQRGVNPCSVEILRSMLFAQSVMERNRSAGDALESFLLLAEAEDGLVRIKESLAEVEGMGNDLNQVRSKGLAVPVTQTEIDQQRLALQHQMEETQAASRNLNGKLAELLSMDAAETRHIWPEVDLKVDTAPLEVDAEVATALATRADLAMLEYLRSAVNPQTLPAIREALGGLSGGLGVTLAAAVGHFAGHTDTGESDHRRGQLDELLSYRRQSVTRDVREAMAEIESSLRQVVNSREQVKSQEQRVENLHQQRAIGASTTIDVRQGRLDLIRKQQQLFHDVVKWKIAVVRLREVQGQLAAEYGYGISQEPTVAPSGDEPSDKELPDKEPAGEEVSHESLSDDDSSE